LKTTENSFPIWNEKYDKMGVTPEELYMRQTGLCWLKTEVSGDGNVQMYCTDGKNQALTSRMLNPTFECMSCVSSFTCKVVKDAVNKDK
jgi:hypothetical protein